MPKPPNLPKLVWVEWRDSESMDGWHRKEEMTLEVEPIRTVGFLALETPITISVSATYHKAESIPKNFQGCIIIPKCAILAWGEIDLKW